MTIQRSVEEIRQIFPNVLETQVIDDLDKAQKDFCEQTKYLERTDSLASPSSNFAWTLPSDYSGFIDLLLYDVDGNPLEPADYDIDYEIQNGVIYFKSTTETPITSLDSAIDSVYLVLNYRPATLSSRGSSYSVNDDHIPGVEALVFQKYYAKYPVDTVVRGEVVKIRDFNAVNYWKSEARDFRIKAKQYVNTRENLKFDSVINYGMGGKFVMPKRAKTATLSSISTPTFLAKLYSKYLELTSVAGVITVSDYSFGWSTTPTASLSSNTLTITSADSEISDTMNPSSNNQDYNVTSWASNQVVLTFGDASGTFKVWIWETL